METRRKFDQESKEGPGPTARVADELGINARILGNSVSLDRQARKAVGGSQEIPVDRHVRLPDGC